MEVSAAVAESTGVDTMAQLDHIEKSDAAITEKKATNGATTTPTTETTTTTVTDATGVSSASLIASKMSDLVADEGHAAVESTPPTTATSTTPTTTTTDATATPKVSEEEDTEMTDAHKSDEQTKDDGASSSSSSSASSNGNEDDEDEKLNDSTTTPLATTEDTTSATPTATLSTSNVEEAKKVETNGGGEAENAVPSESSGGKRQREEDSDAEDDETEGDQPKKISKMDDTETTQPTTTDDNSTDTPPVVAPITTEQANDTPPTIAAPVTTGSVVAPTPDPTPASTLTPSMLTPSMLTPSTVGAPRSESSHGGNREKRTTNQLQWIQTRLIKDVSNHIDAWPFAKPVDPIKLKLPNYFEVIKKPMDLSTIKKLLKHKHYWSAQECIDDFRLIFNNCRTYNPPTDFVVIMGNKIEGFLNERLKEMPKDEIVIASAKKGKPPRIGKIDTAPTSARLTALTTVKPAVAAVVTPTPTRVVTSVAPTIAALDMRQGTPPPSTPHNQLIGSPKSVATNDDPNKPQRRSSSRPVRPTNKDIPMTFDVLGGVPSGKKGKKSKAKISPRMKFCHTIMRELMHKRHKNYSWPFVKPVDVEALQLHDYHLIIKTPMDLGTVKRKLDNGVYHDADVFISDVELVFSNCYKYNPAEHDIVIKCKELHHQFQLLKNKLPEKEATPPPQEYAHESRKSKGGSGNGGGRGKSKANAKHQHFEEEIDEVSEEEDDDDEEEEREAHRDAVRAEDARMQLAAMLPTYDEESEDDADDMAVKNIEQQMALLAKQMTDVRSRISKKRSDKKKRREKKMKAANVAIQKFTQQASTSSSKSASKTKAKVSRTPTAKKDGSASVKKAASRAGSGKKPAAPRKRPAPKSAPKPRKRPAKQQQASSSEDSDSSSSSDDDDDVPMTYDQKRQLSMDISMLGTASLPKVVSIIKQREKSLRHTNPDEIEIDFAQLQNSTCRELQTFVAECLKKQRAEAKDAKKARKKESARLSEAERREDVDRRLANVNEQLGEEDESPSVEQPDATTPTASKHQPHSIVNDANEITQPPPTKRKKKVAVVEPTAPIGEGVSFDVSRRESSGNGPPPVAEADILPAAADLSTDFAVENESAWLSFEDVDSNTAATADADADAKKEATANKKKNDFAMFKRLNEEKKFRDRSDAEEAVRLKHAKQEEEVVRRKAAEERRENAERELERKNRQAQDLSEQKKHDAASELQRLREKEKQELEAMQGDMDLHEQSTMMDDFDNDDDMEAMMNE
eukprot:m.185674 g.185674  ORF g.185674 m.185674 type:complete len:1252 (+) comp32239_c0_seq3:330-4085(+)